MVPVAGNLETGMSHMSDAALSTKDLPLGTLAPEAPYNQLLARAIVSTTAGEVISGDDISTLDLARKELAVSQAMVITWSWMHRQPSTMVPMARFSTRSARILDTP